MDIQTLLGESYKEGMTIEEINAAIADKNFVDPTTLPKSVSKEQFDKTASEAAKYKKELEALTAASMSEEQKRQLAIEEAAQAKSTYAKALSKLRAQEILTAAGLTEKDYSSIIGNFVSEDEETTKASTKAFVDLLTAQKEAASKALKAELLKNTPNPPNGDPEKPQPTEAPKDFAEYEKWRAEQK